MAKILLVEDDNNLREIYEARLQAEGYNIVSANDGEAALVIAKNEKPDLIISDVMMPKISGFEMLDILRNTDDLKGVKVIMLTALGQADDQARASKLGSDRYLVKSQVTLEDIVRVSHELLGDSNKAEAEPGSDTTAAAEPAAPASPPTVTATDTPTSTTDDPAPDMPVATPPEPAAPANDPSAANTPETAPDAPITLTAGAQSSAEEESTVEKQIEDFVDKQDTQPATAPEVPEEPVPATVPEAKEPETPAAPSEAADPTQAADQALSDAGASLLGNAAEPAATTQGADSPAATPEETPTVEPAKPKTGGERVIQPLDSEPKPDLNTLLAVEEAEEAKAQASAPPEPVVG
ncbi:MAG TPA: response regulator, partial [Candidatus Saccharimonadia bacterium]|nr:response regulator [Candidatus Saccharimonadia bacterium]